MATLQKTSLGHLDDVLNEWRAVCARCRQDDFGDMTYPDGNRLIARFLAVVRRVAGRSSAYTDQAEAIVARSGFPGFVASHLVGVVEALRADVAAGYLDEVSELIHGELFADFLEMAKHLLDGGYKDAAAVIAGSSLEAHLRQLCVKHGIDTETSSGGQIRPKKADLMNSELAKAKAYSVGDQKNVTAWLDLRNDAAHGHYAKYESGQVALLIDAVRDFITRHPA